MKINRYVIISKMTIFLLRYAWLVILINVIMAGFFIYQMSKLEVDNDLEIWFGRSDPEFKEYKDFKDRFGSDESIILIYKNQNLFSKEQLDLNRELTEELDSMPGVKSVVSLSSIQVPGLVAVKKGFSIKMEMGMVPLIPRNPDSYDTLRQKITDQEIFVRNIISQDGKTTGIVIVPESKDIEVRKKMIQDIDKLVNSKRYASNHYSFFGSIPIIAESNRISGQETRNFLVFCIILIFALLLYYIRNLILALIPILASLFSVAWTFGIFSLTGHSTNMVAAMIPLIILVLNIALSVHILSRYQHYCLRMGSGRKAIILAINSVFKPCLYTSITTFVGFLAFLTSDMAPVKTAGLYTAIGILLSFGLSFTLLPAMMGYLKIKKSRRSAKLSHSWEKWAKLFSIFTKTYKWHLIIVSSVIFVISIAGIFRIGFESDQIKYFKESNAVRKANNMADAWFDGIYPVELIFTLPENIYKSENPEKYYGLFDSLEHSIRKVEAVKGVHSPLVFLNSIIPDKENKTGFSFDKISEKDMEQIRANDFLKTYLNEDGSHYRISVKTRWLNNEQTIALTESLDKVIDPMIEGSGINYYVTGLAPMYVRLNERLLGNQIRSFAFCFFLIFIILLFQFRKLYLALIGLIPNLLPVVTTLGIMGWLGISLDIATILIAAISLGIAVDDAIHFLTAYKQNRLMHISMRLRIQKTLEKVGRPITLTSILIISGFMIMVFSTYIPFIYFGIFLSLNIFLAFVFDLLLVPAILYVADKNK